LAGRKTHVGGRGKPLIVVESPAKARTIEKAFGRAYKVAASLGHLRDLPRSQLGVDVSQDFEPRYITVRGRGPVVRGLKALAGKARKVYLAADPDREGEAISWHLAHLLEVDPTAPCRIVFHEITKDAIAEAMRNPRPVDMNLVDAQQARRVLDRLVGYELSPLLWRKVRRGLSAGRVQSVAVRLIHDREEEIRAFSPQEYWTITATLSLDATETSEVFSARFVGLVGESGRIEKEDVPDRTRADAIVGESRTSGWSVLAVKRGTRRRNPPSAFTTSTLQQEAANRLGFTVRKTMAVAQQLYEGLELGEAGPVGLITYMRTDATRVSTSARVQATELVASALGPAYLPARSPRAKQSRLAQGAHEAIRPTEPARPPSAVRSFLTNDQFRLYRLIWERFIASEMAAAVYDTASVDIAAGRWGYRSAGSRLRFPGFLAAASLAGDDGGLVDGGAAAQDDSEQEEALNSGGTAALRAVRKGDEVSLVDLLAERHFTSPPPRYSEATLVKAMEELGIGRPSTYAPTIETILARNYVEKQDGRLVPTRLGEVVTDLLVEHFPGVIDVGFTASLEDQLDEVEDGTLPWRKVVRNFYEPFHEALGLAEKKLGRVEVPEEETGILCETCGRPMVVKYGRYGRFLACSGYPECRRTRPYVLPTGAVCPKCGADVVEKRTRKGRRFYGCIRYPECDFSAWARPTERKCPECGSFLVEAGRRGRSSDGELGVTRLRCPVEGCGYEESAAPGER